MKRAFQLTLVVLFIVASGSAYYFYRQASKFQDNPGAQAEEEISRLVSEIGRLMVLPEGETPTVATVSDPERLKDQPFFARAKKGDKVLIYAKAGKAILYSDAERKIIDVAPINLGAPSTGR